MARKVAPILSVLICMFSIAFCGAITALAQDLEGGKGEIVFEEGLSAFEDGNWPVALEKFTETIKLEPDNAQAHHYRGVTLMKLNQPADAVKELEKAKTLDSKLHDVNLDLGQVYQQLGRLDEAERAYREEIRNYPNNAQAHFSCGYVLFVRKRYSESVGFFAKARKLDASLAAPARFYEGAALFKMGKSAEARVAFTEVLSMNPPPEMAAGAKKYLEAIKSKAAPRKNWGVVGSVLYQYDTNVIAASKDTQFPLVVEEKEISDKEDSRAVVTLNAFLRYTKLSPWTFEARYAFYQSWHSEIDIFNLQNHLPSVVITRMQKISGRVTLLRLGYQFGEALLGTNLDWYSTNHWVTPMFGVAWNHNFRTFIGYRFNIEDFRETQPDRDNTAHTGFAKVDWVFWPNRASLSTSAGFDFEDADDVSYDIHRPWVKLALGANLPYKFKGRLSFGYEFEDHYNDDMQNRQDNVYYVEFILFRPLWGPLEATFGVNYKDNDSNVSSLTYDRTIVGGGIVVRY